MYERALPSVRIRGSSETPIVEAPAAGFLDGVSSAPRPYVFEPGAEATSLAPGASLPFDLLLFGGACELQRYALAAIGKMAGEGLGAAIGGRRGTFELARVQGVGPEGAADLLFESGGGGAVVAGPSPAWPGSPLPTDPLPGDGYASAF